MALFKVSGGRATQLRAEVGYPSNEKGLQGVIEANLNEIFGADFLATEYSTGARHGGRIDTLGLDEDGSPVILEYKLLQNENVITQGLFYLDWLLDHRGEFEQLVATKGPPARDISWATPRLILLASNFGRYDRLAVRRIDERIELWTYRLYEGELLGIERLDRPETGDTGEKQRTRRAGQPPKTGATTVEAHIEQMSPEVRQIFLQLRERILDLGEDVSEKALQGNIAYSRRKRMCLVNPGKDKLSIYPIGPVSEVSDLNSLAGKIGHTGHDYMRVSLQTIADLDPVMELIKAAYELQQ